MMEPRAPTPPRRLEALKQLSAAGIPTTVMVAPHSRLNDSEIERILDAAAHAGAKERATLLLLLAARGTRSVSRMADGELSRPLPPRLHPDPRYAGRAAITTRNGERG